jgi:hypothetical protein
LEVIDASTMSNEPNIIHTVNRLIMYTTFEIYHVALLLTTFFPPELTSPILSHAEFSLRDVAHDDHHARITELEAPSTQLIDAVRGKVRMKQPVPRVRSMPRSRDQRLVSQPEVVWKNYLGQEQVEIDYVVIAGQRP